MTRENHVSDQEELQQHLDSLAAEYKVTGAAVAVVQDGDTTIAFTGTANIVTGLPVSRDTLFAAGSVTKVFTASLVMTLVDDGLCDLDVPVQRYLPEFTLQDPELSAQVTTRMLLDHASGLPGNFMLDVPKSPAVVAEQVARLASFPFNSPPGKYWSYSNAGPVVAGRIAEVLTGLTWDEALAERILRPLGLHATTSTEEMILQATAVGHVVDPATGHTERVPRFQVDWGNGPAGATLCLDISALAAFARMHLSKGCGDDGKRVLSQAAVEEMQTPQIDVPAGLGADAFGLGWYTRGAGEQRVIGHTGANAGQLSMLELVPERGGAVAVLTNATTGMFLQHQLTARLLQEHFGITPAAPPEPPAAVPDVDVTRFTGTYVADDGSVVITGDGGKLRVTHETEPRFTTMMRLIYPDFPPPPAIYTPTGPAAFASENGIPLLFVGGSEAEPPEYAYVGRIYRRQS